MLIIQPIGGLCNRMRAINSARILAAKRHEKLTVIWFVNPELGCPFEKIFEPTDQFRVINIHSKWNLKKLWYQLSSMVFGSLIGNSEIRSHRQEGALDDAFVASLRRRLYIATEEHFYPCHDYSAFVPAAPVAAKINAKKQELGTHSIGVHIRRTDNIPAIDKSSTDNFILSMKKNWKQIPKPCSIWPPTTYPRKISCAGNFPERLSPIRNGICPETALPASGMPWWICTALPPRAKSSAATFLLSRTLPQTCTRFQRSSPVNDHQSIMTDRYLSLLPVISGSSPMSSSAGRTCVSK